MLAKLRDLIKKDDTPAVAEELGEKIQKSLAMGLKDKAHLAVSQAKDALMKIGEALQAGKAIAGKAGGALTLVAQLVGRISDFDPAKMYTDLKTMLDKLQSMLINTLGTSSIFWDMAVVAVKSFIESILSNLPTIIATVKNVIEHITDSIKVNAQVIIGGAVAIVLALATGILQMLPNLVGVSRMLLQSDA
jgi:hypothetical protein